MSVIGDVIDKPHAHGDDECSSLVEVTGNLNFNTLHHAVCLRTGEPLEPWTT